ncbi:hypothetical protein Goklo_017235 [Gossypium klotzschianum]|uniref:Helicase C-terminal domain-containing protein n=1 Tax=Gossypium klotzschianum TaxID=34286 RepID=A0A7J8UH50_9ROSI|nr:hypothetical protein [Gossypium klotzschianum]
MLQVGFAEDVETILEKLPAKRQSMMFSATMPNWIKSLTQKHLIWLVGDSDQKLAEGISVCSIVADMRGKASISGPLITEHAKGGKCIVFTQTKRDADRLAYAMARNFKCEALHGDISQTQRETTLSGFRDGRFNILVATDVAARGLDIPSVHLVILFQSFLGSRLKAEALACSMRWELVVDLGQMEVHEMVYMGFFLSGRQGEYGFGRPGGNRGPGSSRSGDWFSDEMGGYAGSSSSCFGSNHQSGNFGGFGELGKSDHSGSFGGRRSFVDFGSGNLGRFGESRSARWALMLMMIDSLDKDPYKFFKVSMISDPCFVSPNSFDALGLVILPHNGFLAYNIWHRFRLLFQPLGWDKHVQMPIEFGSMASVAGVVALSLHIEKVIVAAL